MKRRIRVMGWGAAGAVAGVVAARRFARWGLGWGATESELAAGMTGDEWGADEAGGRSVVATRAISIAAPPETVWPWLAQLCRGAGVYSYDAIDNGGKRSADHIVSWIPEPRLGDASAIGNLGKCQTAIWDAIAAAGRELTKQHGTADPRAWHADATAERINFVPGLLPTTMVYTNRPSGIQQVISFNRHR